MRKIDPSLIKELLSRYYSGNVKHEKAGIKIRCPWHSPDNNPSCMVFLPSGTFYCVVCHGDRPKGKRGVSPYRGFLALGMPEDKAKEYFLSSNPNSTPPPMSFDTPLRSLPNLDNELVEQKKIFYEKVEKREAWPKDWGFRDLDATTMSSSWFRKRFNPMKVFLKKEKLPRLALSIGGAESYKNCEHPNYIHHEVFLRLSSLVKPKSINSHGLTLEPDSEDPLPATLFGLINNKLSKRSKGLMIVEGPYDAMHLLQHIRHPDISSQYSLDVIALLGTPQWRNCLSQLQIDVFSDLIKRNIPIILAFDNDMAGRKLTETAIKDLQSICYLSKSKIKIFNYPSDIKDPGELPFPLFKDCLEQLNILDV